nr:formate/nitrite transporter family protein [Pseudomonas sp. EpS/L25]
MSIGNLPVWGFLAGAFIALGFQHVLANMFILPTAVFAGTLGWAQLLPNPAAVFLGNLVGGAVFVGLGYHSAYRPGMRGDER